MRYLSLFSGIEAATIAWQPLGWECAAVAEVDPFASAVLAHHYPDVPNLGDVTAIRDATLAALGSIDLIIGGFPCQDVSIAGRRQGLTRSDGSRTRSGLFYDAMRIVRAVKPRWLVVENVPGLFSSHQGRDFAAVVGAILGREFDVPPDGWQNAGAAASDHGLVEWATLDAQFFRVPQRRRRVFLVADFGDWTSRAPILLEPESLRGDPPARREAGSAVAALTANGTGTYGADDNQNHADHVIAMAHGQSGAEITQDGSGPTLTCNHEVPILAHTLRADGYDAGEDGTGRGAPLVPALAIQNATRGKAQNGLGVRDDVMYTLDQASQHAVAVSLCGREGGATAEITEGAHPALRASQGGGDKPHVLTNMAVRRIMPREAERLQGFPDDFTRVPYRNKPADNCPDGPRYKTLGNSFAVPVVRWIGERIDAAATHDTTPRTRKAP